MRCAVQVPPFWRGLWLFRAGSGRVLGFWAGFGLGCPSDSRRRQEGFAMHFRDRAPDLRSGLIIGDSGRGLGVLPESALELADRVLFFDSEPVSAAVVGARFLVKLQHFPLRIVELS